MNVSIYTVSHQRVLPDPVWVQKNTYGLSDGRELSPEQETPVLPTVVRGDVLHSGIAHMTKNKHGGSSRGAYRSEVVSECEDGPAI